MPPAPEYKLAENWTLDKRYAEAEKKVLNEDWTQVRAAAFYGVDKSHLNRRIRKIKKRRQEQKERAKDETIAKSMVAQAASPLALDEKRRVPPFWEFDRMYFGHWICPDCGVHHDVPDFHRRMADAIRGDSRRVLINLPPYHSKSTNVTVKDTVYDLVCNPNSRTILISKSGDFAQTFLHSINDIITNHEMYIGAERNLIDDWGPFKTEGSVWSQDRIYIAGRTQAEKDPSVLVLGVGKQIYGRRADKIKFDDIADVENQANPDRVAKMLSWIDKEALSRIGKNGKAIWVGTRVHHGDIYSFLQRRQSYEVLKFPLILDDSHEEVLWPEHFPYSQAMVHREEMSEADFQLIMQQVDVPGVGASFPPELVDSIKDTSRVIGQYEPHWRMLGGVDPAGPTKDSGYTALTVIGLDLRTGARHLVDQIAVKSMKAPQIKDTMIEWSRLYNVYEWRVEGNALQSQLFQYDLELIKALALQGTRVVQHNTHKNKWDPQFGVESLAPIMAAGLWTIPWGNAPTCAKLLPFTEELIAFPMGRLQDRTMSTWFADLAARELLRRDHLPLFNERMTKRWPSRIKRRRGVVDFETREVRRVPLHEQRPGHLTVGQRGYRRLTVGGLVPESDIEAINDGIRQVPFVNREGSVEVPDSDVA